MRLVCDSHSVVDRYKDYFSQMFNVHGVKDVGQTEIHTAEPLVLDPSSSEIELAIEKLKSRKLPGIDQIPAELFKVHVEHCACIFINLLLLFGRGRY